MSQGTNVREPNHQSEFLITKSEDMNIVLDIQMEIQERPLKFQSCLLRIVDGSSCKNRYRYRAGERGNGDSVEKQYKATTNALSMQCLKTH